LYGLSGPMMYLLRRIKRNGLYESNLTLKEEDKK